MSRYEKNVARLTSPIRVPGAGRRPAAMAVTAAVLAVLAAMPVTAKNVNAAATASPTIVVSPLAGPAGDPVAKQIAAVVTQSVGLMLRLTGSFSVVSADFLHPARSYHRAVQYYEQVGASVGIFGTVRPASGGAYTISVRYWRARAPQAAAKTFTTTISNVFAVFDVADRLALKVASAAAGRPLSLGTVSVRNAGDLAAYSVYVDGHLVARDRARVKVLAGRRTVTVAMPGPHGKERVEVFHVVVEPGKVVTVTLSPTAGGGKTTQRKAAEAKGGHGRSTLAARSAPVARPLAGTLVVSSVPLGASVSLDGRPVGVTPLRLARIHAGTYHIRVTHRYFLPAGRSVRVVAGAPATVDAKLVVDLKNPAIAERLRHPLGAVGGSLLWTLAQVGTALGTSAAMSYNVGASTVPARAPTFSFWTPTSVFQPGLSPSEIASLADINLNVFLFRIGNRLAGDPRRAAISDALAMGGTAVFDVFLVRQATAQSTVALKYNTLLAAAGATAVIGGLLYDTVSSGFSAKAENARLIGYVASHGTLPSRRIRRSHGFIIETGGDSILRAGYQFPLVSQYLSVDLTAGLGAHTLKPFGPALSGEAALSYNPWGPKTGNLRPEVFAGVRAKSNFSTVSFAPELGTGNDWVGRHFDLFTRGGVDYNPSAHAWGAFFTVGTRIL